MRRTRNGAKSVQQNDAPIKRKKGEPTGDAVKEEPQDDTEPATEIPMMSEGNEPSHSIQVLFTVASQDPDLAEEDAPVQVDGFKLDPLVLCEVADFLNAVEDEEENTDGLDFEAEPSVSVVHTKRPRSEENDVAKTEKDEPAEEEDDPDSTEADEEKKNLSSVDPIELHQLSKDKVDEEESSVPDAKRRKKQTEFFFKPGQLDIPLMTSEDYFEADEVQSSIDYFTTFFTDKMFSFVTSEANAQILRETGEAGQLTEALIKKYIAVELMMGVIKMPAGTDYWNQKWGCAQVRSIMSLNKYKEIKRSLNFITTVQSKRGLRPMHFLTDQLREQCINTPNEARQSIDEMTIKDKKKLKGQATNEPAIKFYARAGASGFIYDVLIKDGPHFGDNFKFTQGEEHLPDSSKIVLALAKTIVHDYPILSFDSHFTSFELLRRLRRKYHISAVGIVRQDKVDDSFKLNKKTSARGTYIELVEEKEELFLVKWMDHREVILSSNYVGSEPLQSIVRPTDSEVAVDCPMIVSEFNATMGGVGLSQMCSALYRADHRTKDSLAPLWQLLDIAINNAWLLYKRDYKASESQDQKLMSLKDFKWNLAENLALAELMQAAAAEEGEVELTTDPGNLEVMRFDGTNHFADSSQETQRCAMPKCMKRSVFKCEKCNRHLCLKPGLNCFKDYHNIKLRQ